MPGFSVGKPWLVLFSILSFGSHRFWLRARVHVAFFLLTSVLAGCHTPPTEGHYQGALLRKSVLNSAENQKGASEAPVKRVTRERVQIDLTYENSKNGEFLVKNDHAHTVTTLTLRRNFKNDLVLTIPEISNQEFSLTERKKESKEDPNCYRAISSYRVKFCFNSTQFRIDVETLLNDPILVLTGDLLPERIHPEFELPRVYTLTEAIQIALKKNFESQIEFEHMIQAKESARAAYANLVPHISLRSVASIASLNPISAISAITDLVPFLLPSKWLLAKKLKRQAQAQEDALLIMRANMASQLEGMAYAHHHERRVIKILESYLEKIEGIKRDIGDDLNDDISDRLSAFQKKITLSMDQMKVATQISAAAISQTMGLWNPEALQDLIVDQPPEAIETAQNLDFQKESKITVNSSLEMRQLDHLIEASKYQKKTLYFNWLDPRGDIQYNLGINLFSQFKVAKSQIREFKNKQLLIHNSIINKTSSIVLNHNQVIHAFRSYVELLDLRKRILERSIATYSKALKAHTAGPTLESVIKDFERVIDTDLERESYLMQFEAIRARIDRLKLEGYYGLLHPQDLDIIEFESSSVSNEI